jgi:hypothetical protein
MQEKHESGPSYGLRYGYPVTGQARARDILRRKLMRKMTARREQRAAQIGNWARRTP